MVLVPFLKTEQKLRTYLEERGHIVIEFPNISSHVFALYIPPIDRFLLHVLGDVLNETLQNEAVFRFHKNTFAFRKDQSEKPGAGARQSTFPDE